ncbi:hypothetical protein JCM6882_006337 [Rhodosporidiobolus microsporus]
MLAREFVEDSLYNPRYGYFATKVEIFDPDRASPSPPPSSSSSSSSSAPSSSDAPPPPPPTLKDAKRAAGFDFPSFASTAAFEDEVARRYMVFEGRGTGTGEEGAEEGPAAGEKVGRQVWHTPTELFKPWYARALARYILSQYLSPPPPSSSSPSLSSSPSSSPGGAGPSYPYDDLIIYEIGAGNGTLMGDILDYIAQEAPEGVYERTRYRIVEISERLKGVQERRARGGGGGGGGRAGKGKEGEEAGEVVGGGDDVSEAVEQVRRRGHEGKVEVVRKSIFEWDRVVEEPCFFLAMEVLDNFPHDVIRYDTTTHEPLQTTIAIDSSGDFTELFSPISDPLLARYLSLRSLLPSASPYPPSGSVHPLLSRFPWLRKAWAAMPFAPNLSRPEFVPTRQLELLEVLRDKFPRHRVVMSDFSELPDAVEGECGPVVQTRYAGETVPCTTYLVQPGFFDIFFPTDFRTLSELYTLVMSQPSSSPSPSPSASSPSSSSPRLPANFFSAGAAGRPKRELKVYTHAEFLDKWAEVDRTKVRDGSNPLLESYQNARFVVS